MTTKIFDNLQRMLASLGDQEAVPILIMAESEEDLPLLEAVIDTDKVKYRYKVVPALAVTATKEQIAAVAKLKCCRHIEYDAEVRMMLDGANRWMGTAKARTDFAVTGDRDGNQNSFSKNDIVVAVIDTGIDATHVDLAGGKVIAWNDWVNNRTSAYDDNGHGTHVSGIIAGRGQGDQAYTGVAPGAALVGLKVLDAYGSGSLSNVTAAVDWAVQHQAEYNIRIISMSLGTSGSSDGTDTVSLAVNRAAEAGIIPIVAAGNSGPGKSTVGSPGAAEKAITVGAVADPGKLGFILADFSSRGPTSDGRIKPEICAPGVNIMAPKAGSTNQYVAYSGTSMATPFISGTVALMLAANPALTVSQVKEILRTTAHDWGPEGQDVDYGWGLLDGYMAVKQAGGFSVGSPPAGPAHLRFSGTLSGVGAVAEHLIPVTDTAYPLAVTVLMPDWTGGGSPDFDIYLFDPDGTELARSTGTQRQEQVAKQITRAGSYKLQIKSYTGAGGYLVDVSAGAVENDQPPAVAIPEPAEGATVTDTVAVRVHATDDHAVARVEVAVDSGSYLDITGSFDGSAYRFAWDTTAIADGAHVLTARVTDSVGQQAVLARNVTVVNTAPPPPQWVQQIRLVGQVSPSSRDATFSVSIQDVGYVDLILSWSTAADLDFYAYAPDGTYIGSAFTVSNPERLRVDTTRYGTGAYRVRVNLYSGPVSGFELKAEGYRRESYEGTVSQQTSTVNHQRRMGYTGQGRAILTWPGNSDLDLYVLDPTGAERARAFTLANPERAEIPFDAAGTWTVRISRYSGAGAKYQLSLFVPEAVLALPR